MYINTTTFEVLSESQIRSANPNTSFSSQFVPPEGYAYIFPAPKPELTAMQMALSLPPVQVSLGHWQEQWQAAFKYNDYTDDDGVLHTRAEQEEAATEAARVAAVPATVSPRQIRQALTRAGLRTAVEAAVAAGDQDTKDWYEFATEFHRASTVVAELAAALNVDSEQLDDLWVLAASL